MDYRGLLMAVALLGGCDAERVPDSTVELPSVRVVATVYAVQDSAGQTPCYTAPDVTAGVSVTLRNGQRVDLVSVQEGMLQRGGQFWLHVYPRLGHRPSCYINANSLVPVA